MTITWRTSWQHDDIVVHRDEVEVDRIAAERIVRVHLLYRGRGDSPGDIAHSLVELDDAFVLFEPATGFAGRVNFERQRFWQQRACVHWVDAARASLPWRLRLAGWSAPAWRRFEHAALAEHVARWTIGPPQTWEERKQRRIERSRPFSDTSPRHA